MTDPQSARVQEIRAREQAASPGLWGTSRDLEGTYTIKYGTRLTLAEGFASSGDVAVLVGDEETAYRNGTFIARAREDVRWLLAENARLTADHDVAVREVLEDVARALAEGGDVLAADEVRKHASVPLAREQVEVRPWNLDGQGDDGHNPLVKDHVAQCGQCVYVPRPAVTSPAREQGGAE